MRPSRSEAILAEGALDARMVQLVALAAAHVAGRPWRIDRHMKAARREGATPEQIVEAIWIAAELRAGSAAARPMQAGAIPEGRPD